MQERNDSSKNVTKTIITKRSGSGESCVEHSVKFDETNHLEPFLIFLCRYRNQYPILGLLSDDYQVTSPVKEDKTIVIERTGEMIKQVTK